jgi:hypothetical protein
MGELPVPGLGRTFTWSLHVPYHHPAGRVAPGTFRERVSRPMSVYAFPYEVPWEAGQVSGLYHQSEQRTTPSDFSEPQTRNWYWGSVLVRRNGVVRLCPAERTVKGPHWSQGDTA